MIGLSVITVFYHSDDAKEDFLRSVDIFDQFSMKKWNFL